MISYEVYKIVHLAGIILLFLSLGGACLRAPLALQTDNPLIFKKFVSACHGSALFLVLLGGFGLLARLGIVQSGLPLWVLVKLGIWFFMGAALVAAKRMPQHWTKLWFAIWALAIVATACAVFKPS